MSTKNKTNFNVKIVKKINPTYLTKHVKMSSAVVGGGLSGLSAAHYLRKTFPKNAVSVYEASNRLGGWIKSNTVENNIIFEEGPRTIRPIGAPAQNTLQLIEELNLKEQVVPIVAQGASARRMIYANGALHCLPNSITGLFKRQAPFSKSIIRFFLQDIFARKKTVKDESIHDFVSRRFGLEFADYIISPLICGICAGNSKEISVNFLMKNLFEYEQKYGNISTGLVNNFFNKKAKTDKSQTIGDCELVSRAKKERWSSYSFENGLETLPRALENRLKNNVSIELNSKCVELDLNPDQNVHLQFSSGKNVSANHVVASLPAGKLGALVQKQHPELSEMLYKIQSVNVAVVNLQYNKKVISKEAFGFLVPPKEELPILGVIYDSCCFPSGDNTVLTVMMGGAWFEKYFGTNPDEDTLLKIAKDQLKHILDIKEEPTQYKVNILIKCIPQYEVGHNENLENIKEYIKKKNLPLYLCGASYYGVGINDVILSAKTAVEEILQHCKNCYRTKML